MYAPLNIKTCNTLLTSMIKIDDLIKIAKENNLKALTITDNNMYGALDFYIACKKITSNQLSVSKYPYPKK